MNLSLQFRVFLHLYGLSPLWVLMCVVTLLDWENFLQKMGIVF